MEKQPQISSQVIVQSEKEKQLMKQVRKEEKKLQKVASKMDSGRDLDDDDDEAFNPIELRLKRQEALSAKVEPLFKKNRTSVFSTAVKEQYPFVFDSKLCAKATAGKFLSNSLHYLILLTKLIRLEKIFHFVGFVSGQRIILPENVKRTDSQLCEQVDIPIPIIDPLTVGNNRVTISSLDEVCIKLHKLASQARILKLFYSYI